MAGDSLIRGETRNVDVPKHRDARRGGVLPSPPRVSTGVHCHDVMRLKTESPGDDSKNPESYHFRTQPLISCVQ